MIKPAIASALIAALAIAAPAHAQSASGSVQVLGTVGSKCTGPDPFSATIDLGELAQADGTVAGTFPNAVSGLSRSFTIRCTAPDVNIKVSSNALTNTTDATTGNGYTGTVHYTSTLTAAKAGGGNASATYTTADTLPAESVTALGGRMANTTNNLTIAVSAGTTTNAADLLKAGNYTSTIQITVAPI